MMRIKNGLMGFGLLLAALTFTTILAAAGAARAADKWADQKAGLPLLEPATAESRLDLDLINEYKAIAATVDLYIEGGRQGSSEVMKRAFHPGANIHGFADGQVVGGPIQKLYDLVDSRPPAGEIPYSIVRLEAMADVAMVRVDIDDWAGAKYCDMFTLVKDNGQWLITSKVSHKY